MEIQLYCPHCQEVVRVQSELAGQVTSCQRCGGEFRVPAADAAGATASSPEFAAAMSADDQLKSALSTARISCGLLALFSAGLGLHKFALGRTTEGLIMLLTWLIGGAITCGVATVAMLTISWIEGIIYLVLDDEEFREKYVVGKRGWF